MVVDVAEKDYAMNAFRHHNRTTNTLVGRHLFFQGLRATTFRSFIRKGGCKTCLIWVNLGLAVLALPVPFLVTLWSPDYSESIFFGTPWGEVRSDQDMTIDSIARAWTPPSSSWTSWYPWCHSDESLPGLVYVKLDKASSSTLAGINIRLAHKVGAKVHHGGVCSHTKEHFRASTRLAGLHDESPFPDKRLLWTFLRNPADRAMSQYFHFWVSRRGYGVNYQMLTAFLESVKNFQLRYILIPQHRSDSFEMDAVLQDIVQKPTRMWLSFFDQFVFRHYNFIGLVERFDESLAVMTLLWKVEVEDVMVLAAKQSGDYDDGRYQDRCIKIVKPNDFSPVSKEARVLGKIKDYLQTKFVNNNLDYTLYNAVNASLDKTISILGTEKVDQTVRMLRLLREQVEAQCRSKAIFPCSQNGTRQLEFSSKNCYWYDSGCGYPCVDKVVETIGGIV
jgi:hypothetical protein